MTAKERNPMSIIIIGSGVFGLTTALALAARPKYRNTSITVVDKSPFPAPDGSSIDNTRIVRADYADEAYAQLGHAAQAVWRRKDGDKSMKHGRLFNGVGDNGRYNETGLVLVTDPGVRGEDYVRKAYENVRQQYRDVEWLDNREAIQKAVKNGGASGQKGYVNWNSGWVDAEAAMRWVRERCKRHDNIVFKHGHVERLSIKDKIVHGVVLEGGEILHADLTIVAAGAWSAGLLDLEGRAVSTGHVMAYMEVTPEEEELYKDNPVILSFTSGLFMFPPKNGIVKVVRHAYGYTNYQSIPHPERLNEITRVSIPVTSMSQPGLELPLEGVEDLRSAVREMLPALAERPFFKTRLCWYTDTPTGDWIITYHPELQNLFVATGGSGHAFKFLPVIGEKIADTIEGKTPAEFTEKWRWREKAVEALTKDGSRGGEALHLDLQTLLNEDKRRHKLVLSKL